MAPGPRKVMAIAEKDEAGALQLACGLVVAEPWKCSGVWLFLEPTSITV